MLKFRHLVASALAVVVAASVLPAGAAPSSPPSLRLHRASPKVTLERWGKRVFLQLGVYAAPVGEAFVLHVGKPAYGSDIAVRQVDADTGATVRDLPADILNGWNGLDDFATVSVYDGAGALVRSRTFDFCPNSYERQRLGDTGPQLPTYPDSCGSYFPFTRGSVWGIDYDWAVELMASDYYNASMRLPVGTYTATVEIDPRHVDIFGIEPEDAKVDIDLTVEDAHEGGGKHGLAPDGSRRTPEFSPSTGVPTVTDPAPATVPDLAALPAWGIGMRNRRDKEWLTFAASPWNEGPAPLVIEGFRRPDEDVMDAYQYFQDADGNVVGRAPVGTFDFDHRRGHKHWHFEQFARFSLIALDGNEIVRSRKQTFCLYPTDAVDLTVPGANYTPWSVGLDTVCGGPSALWVREELDVGWADTYYQSRAGQAFNVTELPNGWYAIKVEVDPTKTLYQASTANDVETRIVRLGGKPGKRRVTVVPWNGIDA